MCVCDYWMRQTTEGVMCVWWETSFCMQVCCGNSFKIIILTEGNREEEEEEEKFEIII